MCTCTTALCACWCAEQPEDLLASVADALGEKYVEELDIWADRAARSGSGESRARRSSSGSGNN